MKNIKIFNRFQFFQRGSSEIREEEIVDIRVQNGSKFVESFSDSFRRRFSEDLLQALSGGQRPRRHCCDRPEGAVAEDLQSLFSGSGQLKEDVGFGDNGGAGGGDGDGGGGD